MFGPQIGEVLQCVISGALCGNYFSKSLIPLQYPILFSHGGVCAPGGLRRLQSG